jgi:hypothetical protein
MRSTCLVIVAAMSVAGCASGGQAVSEDSSDRVTIMVGNDFASAVTAYAVWPGGRRNRLGEIQPDRTRTFETVRAGDEIALGVELTSAPPRGTTAGPTGFQGGAPPRLNPEMVMGEGIMISPGEGIEWRITSTGSLVYRRLVPE